MQVDSNQEKIRGKVLESNISNDDNEELSDGEETENWRMCYKQNYVSGKFIKLQSVSVL